MNHPVPLTCRLGGALVALAIALLAHGAVSAHAEQPSIVYQNLHEGDVLGQGPYVVQMCFAKPINIKDLDKGGDFDFRLLTAEKQGHGLRIVFQPDAYGVAVYPGDTPSAAVPVETAEGGRWTFHYRVVDAEDETPAEGDIHFTVEEGADPIPRATPPVCVPEGGTATPDEVVSQPTGTGTPGATGTPSGTGSVATDTGAAGSESPGASGSPTVTPAASDNGGDDGGTDVLPIVLLAVGAVGVIGGAAAVVYLMRRRRTV